MASDPDVPYLPVSEVSEILSDEDCPYVSILNAIFTSKTNHFIKEKISGRLFYFKFLSSINEKSLC